MCSNSLRVQVFAGKFEFLDTLRGKDSTKIGSYNCQLRQPRRISGSDWNWNSRDVSLCLRAERDLLWRFLTNLPIGAQYEEPRATI